MLGGTKGGVRRQKNGAWRRALAKKWRLKKEQAAAKAAAEVAAKAFEE